MKVYRAFRTAEGPVKAIFEVGEGEEHELPHIPLHSPTGFEMGYVGSGPADLALAILCEHLGVEDRSVRAFCRPQGVIEHAAHRAWMLHQRFKDAFVATQQHLLTLTSDEIETWIVATSRRIAAAGGTGR